MFSVEFVLQQVVNGLTLAAIYALVAVGVSLFFGAIGVVNLSHGDVATVGAFAALAVQQFLAQPVGPMEPIQAGILALFAGVAAAGLTGWLLYNLAFRPLENSPAVIGLLASIAAGFVMREAIFNFYPNARNPQPFSSFIPVILFDLQGVFILAKQVFVMAMAVFMVVALGVFLARSRMGRAMRSVLNSREISRSLGVPVVSVVSSTFILGSALAGIAGVLNGMTYSIVQFDMGILLTIKGFTAAVIGGLGNVYGALVGALVVGMIESFTGGFIPQGSAYKEVAVFAILILILVLKPEGIMGRVLGEKV
jgi:branched-chain amino acid transport system permease protein